MKENFAIDAINHIDNDLVEEYAKEKEHLKRKRENRKRTPWIKWASVAACLCVMFVAVMLLIPDNVQQTADVQTITYNDTLYIVCGSKGEADVLEQCGLPRELTADLAGEQISYMTYDKEKGYIATNEITDMILYEYAPHPGDNVYILLLDGEYYAAIDWTNCEYHDWRD